MNVILWKPEMESSIELIDKQHKEILEAANTFIIKCRCNQDQAAAKDALQFLQQYVAYHFQAEETYQMKSGYPKYRQHQAVHSDLATQVKFLSVKLEASNFAEDEITNFHHFFGNLIIAHILGTDMEFFRYYKQWQAEKAAAGK